MCLYDVPVGLNPMAYFGVGGCGYGCEYKFTLASDIVL